MVDGGIGGNGGRGGHGGGGGGGGGGVSFDIYVFNANAVDPGYGASNTFPLAATATGGAGGQGGNSSNLAAGRGQDGPTGDSGAVRLVP